MKQITTYLSIPVSKKVLLKIAASGNEIPALLEDWATSDTVKEEKKDHVSCTKHNQRIAIPVCLSRRKNRKKGCVSCKTGKTLQKIQDLQKELK